MTPDFRAVLSDDLVRAAAAVAPITASSRTHDIPVRPRGITATPTSSARWQTASPAA
jgi:hypothetical protein